MFKGYVNSFIKDISQLNQNNDCWSLYKDAFDAKLQTFAMQSQQWLLGAVLGEIGFNTFDHNFQIDSNRKGLYCNFEYGENTAALLDFGCGIKTSLSKVKKDIKTDKEALRIAFTEIISGRAPEQRGNGLKFVLSSVIQNNWNMYFHSGSAYCLIDKDGYTFKDSEYNHIGCFCVIGW